MASTVEAPMRDKAQKMRVEWLIPDALPVRGDRIISRDGRGYWLLHQVAPLLSAAGCDPERPWLFIIASRHVGEPPDCDDGALYSWDCTGQPGLLLTATPARPKAPRRRAGAWKPGDREAVFA